MTLKFNITTWDIFEPTAYLICQPVICIHDVTSWYQPYRLDCLENDNLLCSDLSPNKLKLKEKFRLLHIFFNQANTSSGSGGKGGNWAFKKRPSVFFRPIFHFPIYPVQKAFDWCKIKVNENHMMSGYFFKSIKMTITNL